MKRYYQYVDDVESGRVIACDALKKAVARFAADLADSHKRGARWVFDEAQADRVIYFIERLKHFEEPFTGKPIILEPWECFFIGQLYGWRSVATGKRRFTKALLFMARKQGKTILASALALYEILEKPGIEAYSLATKQLISNKAFKNLRLFIQKNPGLVDLFEIRKSPQSIYCPENESTFTPLSSDSDLDGLNPAYVIIDELAAQANGIAYSILTSGMGTRSEPLTVIISTASASLENPLIEEYEYAKKILNRTIEDDSFLAAIYEFDRDDRWDDLSKMQKSCPNLGVSVPLDFFDKELRRAKVIPIAALEYQTKYCNLWQSASDTWIPDTLWSRCMTNSRKLTVASDELERAPCMIGVDFSTIWDYTALTRYFYIERAGKYYALHRFYIPEAQVETKAHMETPSIRRWIEGGLIVPTPGESIDYAYLFRDVEEYLRAHKVVGIAYDPAKAKDFERQFENRTTIFQFPQKAQYISPAAKAWEKAIVENYIADDNPVMRWMVSNAINKSNPDSGSYFITKSPLAKDRKRIDGVMTSIMAFSTLQAYIQDIQARPALDLSKITY